jgi:TonB family protein
MIRKPELETRVRSILDPSRPRSSAGILIRCAIAVAALALVLPIALTAQGKVYKLTKDMTAPRVLYKEEPQYTPEAKNDKIEGTVVIQAEIMIDGSAQNIRVTRSLDPGLDANAITAVSHWRFQPGMKDGEPVNVAVTIEMNFHLL